jgi:hypothetical protein
MTSTRIAVLLLSSGAVAAMAAAACCAAPRIVALLGCKLRWAAQVFTELAPYQPLFVTIAAVCFGLAHYRLYDVPLLSGLSDTQNCTLRRQRRALVTLVSFSFALLLFPLYAPRA